MIQPTDIIGDDIRLYRGDAIEVLRDLPEGSADCVITDPPYSAAGGSTNGRSEGSTADTQFFLFWFRAVWDELRRVVKPSGCAFVFCDWRMMQSVCDSVRPHGSAHRTQPWRVSQMIVWDRDGLGMGSPFRNAFEMIAFARGPDWESALPRDISNIVRHRWPYGAKEHHGAEKPVELCEKLVRWAIPRGGVVLDPFLGSGSTALSCQLQGVKCIGIEGDEKHYATALRRLTHAAGKADDQLFSVIEGTP